ncbi:alpha/beta fold hydrolase [Nocardia sp. NBC_00511]|uniref:alpha/beta fold hydrolase n=1 Tax=Nocardia sp. NBC_00511 TaxID=2903591 RepID=UPI0030E39119
MSRNAAPGTETAVTEVWREVLDLDDIRPDDSFSELGGSSLQMVELRDAVQQRFGIRLSIADLASADTVAALAVRLEETDRREYATGTRGAVRIGSAAVPGNERIRLFCLPGSGGSSWSFVPLANRLPDVTLYAVCQRGLERRGLPHYRMKSLVRHAVRAIRAVQPAGPYYLLGHSMGGVAAAEVAAELERGGGEVALVVLLDATLPTATARNLGLSIRPPEQASSTAEAAITARIMLYASMFRAGLADHDIGRRQELFYQIGLRVQNRHRLRPRSCRALAVVTADTEHQVEGWRRVLGDFPVVTVSGAHMDVVREGPVLWELAGHVHTALTAPQQNP